MLFFYVFALASIIIFLAIRYWKVSVVLIIAVICLGHNDHRKSVQQRVISYDPRQYSQEDLDTSIRIVVPAHADDYAEWPVTIANNAKRSFEGEFVVSCTATETVLDGTSNWVIGVRQYPYIMSASSLEIASNSIATFHMKRASDDYGPLMNLTECGLYDSDSSAKDSRQDYAAKWVKVTPIGAARASQIGYTWMGLPLAANSENYQSQW